MNFQDAILIQQIRVLEALLPGVSRNVTFYRCCGADDLTGSHLDWWECMN